MSYYDHVVELCNKYNIQPDFESNLVGNATGIGDIILRILCIKNNLITTDFVVNLNWFTKLYYKSDPINQLEFRIQLINDLLKYNNIPTEKVKYVFSCNAAVDCYFPIIKLIIFI
jgi:hypothetical protein